MSYQHIFFGLPDFEIILTMVALKSCSARVDTKDNDVSAAVVFDVECSIMAEFEGHAAVNETVAVQSATETRSLVSKAPLAPPGRRRFRS